MRFACRVAAPKTNRSTASASTHLLPPGGRCPTVDSSPDGADATAIVPQLRRTSYPPSLVALTVVFGRARQRCNPGVTPSLTSPAAAGRIAGRIAGMVRARTAAATRPNSKRQYHKLAAGDTDVRVSTAGDADPAVRQTVLIWRPPSQRAAVRRKQTAAHSLGTGVRLVPGTGRGMPVPSFGGSTETIQSSPSKRAQEAALESEFIRASEQEMAAHRAIAEATKRSAISNTRLSASLAAAAGYRSAANRSSTNTVLAGIAAPAVTSPHASWAETAMPKAIRCRSPPVPAVAATTCADRLAKPASLRRQRGMDEAVRPQSNSDAGIALVELPQLFRHDNERSAFKS